MATTMTLDDLHATFGRDITNRRWTRTRPGSWTLDGYPVYIDFLGYDADQPFALRIGHGCERFDLLVDAMRRGNARATEIDLGDLTAIGL